MFEEKQARSQEDLKAGRRPRPLREFLISAVYAENELSTQMTGDQRASELLASV